MRTKLCHKFKTFCPSFDVESEFITPAFSQSSRKQSKSSSKRDSSRFFLPQRHFLLASTCRLRLSCSQTFVNSMALVNGGLLHQNSFKCLVALDAEVLTTAV